ncbi:hypothetical protein Tco_0393262 [Tanacetum coccineum]
MQAKPIGTEAQGQLSNKYGKKNYWPCVMLSRNYRAISFIVKRRPSVYGTILALKYCSLSRMLSQKIAPVDFVRMRQEFDVLSVIKKGRISRRRYLSRLEKSPSRSSRKGKFRIYISSRGYLGWLLFLGGDVNAHCLPSLQNIPMRGEFLIKGMIRCSNAIISDRLEGNPSLFCNDQFAKSCLNTGVSHRLSTRVSPTNKGQYEDPESPDFPPWTNEFGEGQAIMNLKQALLRGRSLTHADPSILLSIFVPDFEASRARGFLSFRSQELSLPSLLGIHIKSNRT